ncbi:MAG: dihydroorotate dehydrogenase electron transfer subunit [bacterium]|nr:dihydroorotate dehydrogenase electron transfer subunit [bacterium]
MELEQAEILEHREVAPGYRRLVLAAPAIAGRAGPGQFVHLRVGEGPHPLLRRPLSVAGRRGEALTLLYRVVGEGTALLATRRPGERLDLLGPLGRGFTFIDGREPLLVAGGAGVAPLLFLAAEARAAGRKPLVLLGVATAAEVVGEDELAALGIPLEVSTDDGSRGRRGPVTDLLAGRLEGKAIYACGPAAMVRRLKELAPGVPGQVSLEAAMACGVGACRGCACRTAGGYRMVCADGPVFDLGEVVFDE